MFTKAMLTDARMEAILKRLIERSIIARPSSSRSEEEIEHLAIAMLQEGQPKSRTAHGLSSGSTWS